MQSSAETKSPPQGDPLIGRVLNERYRLLEVVGVGGMATVYKAVQEHLERIVALKVLNHHYAAHTDPNFLRRFLREANLSSKLRHQNTVTVLDYGHTDDGVYYIAMEYLEGETLSRRLSRQGPLPWPLALDLTQQICRSLREAHRMGIVHRDLKPANIMLLTEGDHVHVKVLDFGLVKPLQSPTEDGQELTAHGMFLGSPIYMAPEQSRNYSDVRSDIYSLGIVLYQMLTGRPPFVSKDYLELINLHHKHRPESPSSVRPGLNIPEAVDAAVMRCLKKNPESRYQDTDELIEALRKATEEALSAGPSSSVSSEKARKASTEAPTEAISLPDVESALAQAPETPTVHEPTIDIRLSDPGTATTTPPGAPSARYGRGLMFGTLASLAGMAVSWGVTSWLRADRNEGPPTALIAAPGYMDLDRSAIHAPEPVKPPAVVNFRLATEPNGAQVFSKGQRVGTTPMTLDLAADPATGIARVEVTFLLKGYHTETLIAGGQGQVLLTQRMQKLATAKGPTPSEPPQMEVVKPATGGPANTAASPDDAPASEQDPH